MKKGYLTLSAFPLVTAAMFLLAVNITDYSKMFMKRRDEKFKQVNWKGYLK